MNISKINLRVLGACVAFASKEETRYYLNGVCLEIEPRCTTYIATDGHRLIAYRENLDVKEEQDNTLTGTFIIPSVHCKPFKLDKEDDGTAKIFGEGGKRLTIAHGFVDVTFAPIDDTYPDWRTTIPKGQASGEVSQFNADYLAAFRKFGKLLSLTELPIINHNGANPALVWFSRNDNVLGVIMPHRADDMRERQPPKWAISAIKAAA